MAILESIWRYPVKSMAGQKLSQAELRKDFGLEHDRKFALLQSDSEFSPNAPQHLGKNHFLNVMRHPIMSEFRAIYHDKCGDGDRGILEISRRGSVIFSGDMDDETDNQKCQSIIRGHLGGLAKNPIKILSAKAHIFSDIPENCLSIINLKSSADMSKQLGQRLDKARFRANLYYHGAEPWQERHWQKDDIIMIGAAKCRVLRGITRCAAINVNRQSHEQDHNLPKILLKKFKANLMGVYLAVENATTISVGDSITYHSPSISSQK